MYRLIRLLDGTLDFILTLGMVLMVLTGAYFIYDTAYIYYYASAARAVMFRPGTGEPSDAGEERSLTEDYVGWLNLEDTGIDYPIMQGEDNSKYLNTNPYGEYSLTGSIFLDSRNAPDFSDSYSLVYGHHMSGGIMFGALDKYYNEGFFENHRRGELSLREQTYELEVFAVLLTDANVDPLFNPEGSGDVLRLAEETALYYKEPENGQVLALSTCKDPGSTSRTMVLLSMTEREGGK